MSDAKKLRVIIAGGGIAGLALANSLQKADIDYVLLEGRGEIAPQVGASIGIMPNGCRIMDQLGFIEELDAGVEPLVIGANRDVTGNLIHPKLDSVRLAVARSGYGIAFGDRQHILRVMHKHIADKSKVLLNKRIKSVDDSPQGVKVYCTDGSVYEGDILAGADGVYSKVRQEMWRYADAAMPGLIPKEEKQCMRAEYQCLYGICPRKPNIDLTGELSVTYMKGKSMLVIGRNNTGDFFVFLNEKMKKVYRAPDIPKFTEKDTQDFIKRNSDVKVLPNFTFGQMMEGSTAHKLVALDEADFKTWTFGRIACVGDSIHKFTPDAGQGGNTSIESAAALANALKRLTDTVKGRPTKAQVEDSLKEYQKSRETRIRAIIEGCNNLTRVHAMSNWFNTFFVHHLIYRLGDTLMDLQADFTIGAHKLDFLPPPKRSLEGTMPFNPLQGEGYKERKLKRALFTLPLVALWYFGNYYAMTTEPLVGALEGRLTAGKIEWATGSVPLRDSFYQIGWLDELWGPLVAFFDTLLFGYDQKVYWQAFSFLFDLGPVLAIFYIESTRRSNAFTLAQLPLLYGIAAQFRGIGVIIPFYLIPHYITTPISNFKATDMRLTSFAYTSAVLPALLIGYYIPTFAQEFHPSLSARQDWNWIWQMWPVWISALTWGISKLFFTDTMLNDRLYDTKKDLPVMRYTVGTCVAISALAWWYTLASSGLSPLELFIPRHLAGGVTEGLDAICLVFIQWDEVLMVTHLFVWLALLFWDMKYAGMVTQSWVAIIGYAAGSLVLLGPGATLGLGWLWREDVITNKRHWAAVTKESTQGGRRDSGIGHEGNGFANVGAKKMQ